MSITSHTYSKLPLSMGTKLVNLSSDTIKAMLLASYTVGSTVNSAQFVSDVLAVATEATGGGYTAGGVALSPTFTASGGVVTLNQTGSTVTFGTGTNAVAVLFYDATPGSSATNPVLSYWDLGGTVSVTTLTIDAAGIVTFTGTG